MLQGLLLRVPNNKRTNPFSPAEFAAAGVTPVIGPFYYNHQVNELRENPLVGTANQRQAPANKKPKVREAEEAKSGPTKV